MKEIDDYLVKIGFKDIGSIKNIFNNNPDNLLLLMDKNEIQELKKLYRDLKLKNILNESL